MNPLILTINKLVEEQMRDHGTTPSYMCCNEGIVPGFQVVGISRRLEGHDLMP